MLRLSIIIPLQRNSRLLEESLVTVLENRPSDAEVLVVLDGHYDDPYDLQDEVRFVDATGLNPPAAFNAGLKAAQGSVIHFLSCGVEATAGWADAALAAFDDAGVAAAAPAIHHRQQPERCLLQGVSVARAARRIAKHNSRRSIIGPSILGGFYRRDALEQSGGLAEDLGAMADADLLLRLIAAGWTSVAVPDSVLLAREQPKPRGLKYGLHAERFYLRHAAQAGFFTKACHPCQVAWDCCAQWPHFFSAMGSLLGRSWAWIEQLGQRGPASAGQEPTATQEQLADSTTATAEESMQGLNGWQRIDGPHAEPRRESRASTPAANRVHEW